MRVFQEYSHIRVKKDGHTGIICDKHWNDAAGDWLYTVEYDNPKNDSLFEHILFNPYRFCDLELVDTDG